MRLPDSTGPSEAMLRPVRALPLAFSRPFCGGVMGKAQQHLVPADVAATDDSEAEGDRLAGLDGRRRVDGSRSRAGPGGRCLGRGGARQRQERGDGGVAKRRPPPPDRDARPRPSRAGSARKDERSSGYRSRTRAKRRVSLIRDLGFGASCRLATEGPRRRLLDALQAYLPSEGREVGDMLRTGSPGCPRPPPRWL